MLKLNELYQQVQPLGQGGMSTVYLAIDPQLGRRVAIKVLDINHTDSTHALREAQLLAQFNHPNIVHVYKVHQDQTQLAIEMEYVEGATLKHHLKANRLSTEQKLEILLNIANGLDAAHNKNILHLDLKLDNILIDEQGSAKIADFGISQFKGESQLNTSSSFGSLTAMSPEQLNKQPLDSKSDLFSFGLLAYQLFAERHPYASQATQNTPTAIAEQIKHVPCQADARHVIDMPSQLGPFLNRLLSYEKALRPNNFADVAHHIKQLLLNVSYDNCDVTQAINDTPLENPLNHTRAHNIADNKDEQPAAKKRHPSLFTSASWSASLLVTLLISLAGAGYWYWLETKPKTYLAALPIHFDEQHALTDTQKRIVNLGMADAISNFTFQNNAMLQVSNSEVKTAIKLMGEDASLTDLGKALGADLLLEPILACRASICEVTLNTIESEKASIINTVRYSVDSESFSEIYSNTILYINDLFSESYFAPLYSQQMYQKYVTLAEQAKSGHLSLKQKVTEIKQLIREAPNFHPLYKLYREVAIHAHSQSSDNTLLYDLLDVLENAPESYKQSPVYVTDKVRIYQTLKEWNKAEELLAFLESSKKIEQYELLMLKASLLREQNNNTAALINVTKAYQLRPTLQATRNTAIAYFFNGNYQQAIEYLDLVNQMAPNDVWALNTFADISLASGNTEQAIDAYLRLIIDSPDTTSLHSNLSIGYMLQGNYTEALKSSQRAYDSNSASIYISLNFADSLTFENQLDKANAIYHNIIIKTEEAKDLDALLVRVQALLHTGKKLKALRLFNKIEKQDPNLYDSKFIKAMMLTKLGEYQSALVAIEESLDAGWNIAFYKLPWFIPLCEYNLQLSLSNRTESLTAICTEAL
ncbi:serine/threonine protein kinase, bacterial [Pseudoalteromonas citrea]|uniref:Serine/threonine protein kinase, bacterial n=2 Tax=Pseudoalteromonas citrea TaxID=43655 RepID=A0AAD4AK47_9GAMM|nr:serine/threonine-protein kinase [Pseudoalteromonas citrea]KAF7772385.1 serine/threonine protein kinase, bacterial [Pseudoalteromonas citrea]